MKRSIVLGMVLSILVLPALFWLAGCTDLQEATDQADTTATTILAVAESTDTQPTTAPVATTVAPTTTVAPATTTTASVGSTSTLVQLLPGTFQVKPEAVKIEPNLLLEPTRYEDIHPYLHWEGSWHTNQVSSATGGTVRASQVAGSYVEVFFKGTGVRLVTTKGVQGGKLRIVLTGNGMSKVETVSLYNATPLYQQTVWYSGHLTNADYAIYFEHDTSNVGFKVVWIDAIDIWGTITPP